MAPVQHKLTGPLQLEELVLPAVLSELMTVLPTLTPVLSTKLQVLATPPF